MQVFPKKQIAGLDQSQIEKFIILCHQTARNTSNPRRIREAANRNRTNCYIELERNRK